MWGAGESEEGSVAQEQQHATGAAAVEPLHLQQSVRDKLAFDNTVWSLANVYDKNKLGRGENA